MKEKLAITSVSLIRNSEEREVVLATLTELNKFNLPIIIVDGGSSRTDKKRISSFSNVKLLEVNKGLTHQLILSHRKAAKQADFLFYLHTDKLSFVKNNCQKIIEYYDQFKNKGMLIPVRSEESLNTYPFFQRKQEEFLNFFMSDYIGTVSDYYAGPKIYPAKLVNYLDQLKGDIGWGIEAYFYVIAKRLHFPFNFIDCQMVAPKEIESEEKAKLYRLQITSWQIDGFLQGLKVEFS